MGSSTIFNKGQTLQDQILFPLLAHSRQTRGAEGPLWAKRRHSQYD